MTTNQGLGEIAPGPFRAEAGGGQVLEQPESQAPGSDHCDESPCQTNQASSSKKRKLMYVTNTLQFVLHDWKVPVF